jgi:hypothetical protein
MQQLQNNRNTAMHHFVTPYHEAMREASQAYDAASGARHAADGQFTNARNGSVADRAESFEPETAGGV